MPDENPAPGKSLPIGLMVVGSEMASFTIIGLLLDFGLGTMPGFTIGLTLLGLCAALYHLVKMSQALAGKGKTPEPPPGGSAGGDAGGSGS